MAKLELKVTPPTKDNALELKLLYVTFKDSTIHKEEISSFSDFKEAANFLVGLYNMTLAGGKR